MHILVVEDEKKVASFIQRGLEGEGFTVDVANDGESGVELGSKNNYDLILMDIMLPKMDGLEAVRALRAKDVSSPVLCLTAKDTVEDIVIRITDISGRQSYSSTIQMQPNGLEYVVSVDVTGTLRVGPPATFPVNVLLRDTDTHTIIDEDRRPREPWSRW